jgi:uncharacterized membrane protein
MRRLGFLPASVLVLSLCTGADDTPKKYRVVTTKPVGIIATGLNSQGDLVGFEWAEEKNEPNILAQKPFFARGKEITYLPLLKGFTSTSPAAVSDDGLVVGHVSKPAPPGRRVQLPDQAFVWDAKAGIRGLELLPGDAASFATGITRDGKRICGYSVGPDRVRACVWDRKGTLDEWKGTPLPHQTRLGSKKVAINGNGEYITAADGTTPCLWTQDRAGVWIREAIAEPETLIPRAVNDSGMVVGMRFKEDGYTHAVVWTRAGGCRLLKEPESYASSEASAVNNLGIVVGMIDGPRGSKVEPRAFLYEANQLRVIEEGGPLFESATAINDRGDIAGVLEEKEVPE